MSNNPWKNVIGTTAYNQNLSRLAALADDKGYSLNNDIKRVEKVVGLMTINYNTYSAYYCPCKQSHPLDKKTNVTCPCPEWEDEITEDGYCFCRLFFKK